MGCCDSPSQNVRTGSPSSIITSYHLGHALGVSHIELFATDH